MSSWCCRYPDDLVRMARRANFRAVEWDLNYIPFPLSQARCRHLQDTFTRSKVYLRYHLPYSTCDVGSSIESVRERSLAYLQLNIELLARLNAGYGVLHFCQEDIKGPPPLSELCELVQVAQDWGITIGLENLMAGPTSDPATLEQIALDCGAEVALDVGHALSTGTFAEYLDNLGPLVSHVHFYGSEDEHKNHLPFSCSDEAVSVAQTIQSHCDALWWTCELDSLQLGVRTRDDVIAGSEQIE